VIDAAPNTGPGERALFFRHWLRRPLGIGALWPSGPAVARAMARALPRHLGGPILELGGGTGTITRGLINAGCAADRLLVLEREAGLAQMLRRRLPAVRVIEADARDLGAVLAASGVTYIAGVVSSLPIKWLDREGQRAIVAPCFDRLDPGGSFLQLTNAFASPLPHQALGLDGAEIARLWSHFPPVQIWRYWRAQ
jgi:phosphatidylethanolamine/phosphatidyl-N-methylethanolamine N-methyltransferase